MSTYDGLQQIQRRKRMVELAAMLKEKKKGNMNLLEKIVHKFSIREGVKPETGWHYVDSFIKTGLVTFYNGEKRWKYNVDSEWDVFNVNI